MLSTSLAETDAVAVHTSRDASPKHVPVDLLLKALAWPSCPTDCGIGSEWQLKDDSQGRVSGLNLGYGEIGL